MFIALFLRRCCRPSYALQIAVIIAVLLFILIGAIIFQALENENAITVIEQEKQNFLLCVHRQMPQSRSIKDNEQTDMAHNIAKNCFKTMQGQWNFAESVLFAFSIVTTIGYGNLFPCTFLGQLFCCIYVLIGIPLTMIAIANIGKYLAALFQRIERNVQKLLTSYASRHAIFAKYNFFGCKNGAENGESHQITGKTFIIVFLLYIAFGSYAIAWWEPELTSYTTAVYFNLLSLTSTGLGDYWPKNGPFLVLTLLYLTVGLAITTIALDIASDYLRKLHFYRQKIGNVRNVIIRIGSKKVTIGRFLTVICNRLGVNPELIDDLDLDDIVQAEIGDLDESKHDDDSFHSECIAFDPEISACIDAEKLSLLSGKYSESKKWPVIERYELLWPPPLNMSGKVDVPKQEEQCEIMLKQLIEKYEAMESPVQRFAQFEINEVRNSAITLEISCEMLPDIRETLLFPEQELALTALVEYQDKAMDVTMIPFKVDEFAAFYDQHRNAVRKNSNPIPGRPVYQYDPKKTHETYRKEWERIEQVKKKHVDELAKKRRQRALESLKRPSKK